jgi:hypothetical protein
MKFLPSLIQVCPTVLDFNHANIQTGRHVVRQALVSVAVTFYFIVAFWHCFIDDIHSFSCLLVYSFIDLIHIISSNSGSHLLTLEQKQSSLFFVWLHVGFIDYIGN